MQISFKAIKAVLLHEAFITRHSFEVINDILLYPLLSIVVFGFLTIYISGFAGSGVANNVLIGIILWQAISITQYSISISALWDIWSRNLTNIFIAPISNAEYLMAYTISGGFKSIILIILASIMSHYVFHFDILDAGFVNLVFFFINLAVFAFGFGIFILGMLFRFGTRIQAFAWALITIFQPLMAVYYPVSVLPQPFRTVAYFFPPTYIFEAARISLRDPSPQWDYIIKAILLNIVFVSISVTFFNAMFKKSKKIGQFARLEG